MDFPRGTKFRDEVDPETGQKIKVKNTSFSSSILNFQKFE